MRFKDLDGFISWMKTTSPNKAALCNLINPVVTVATSSVVICPANTSRKGLIIFNNSSNSGYVSLASVSVAATCTRLIATFTSWEFFPSGLCYQGAVSAIRNAGTGGMAVWEFV